MFFALQDKRELLETLSKDKQEIERRLEVRTVWKPVEDFVAALYVLFLSPSATTSGSFWYGFADAYSGRFATTTAGTSGSQRGGKRSIYNHSIFAFFDTLFIHSLLACCRHCWIYFLTSLELYMFQGARNGVMMYYKLYNLYDRDKT